MSIVILKLLTCFFIVVLFAMRIYDTKITEKEKAKMLCLFSVKKYVVLPPVIYIGFKIPYKTSNFGRRCKSTGTYFPESERMID